MSSDPGRILAVDPGKKHLGLAVSDPTRTIAAPLDVIQHTSLRGDAQEILRIASEQEATLILIGQPLHWDGSLSEQAQESTALAETLQELGELPVELVDEYGSTQEAQQAGRKLKLPGRKSSSHLDDLAAAIILQNYLEAQLGEGPK